MKAELLHLVPQKAVMLANQKQMDSPKADYSAYSKLKASLMADYWAWMTAETRG